MDLAMDGCIEDENILLQDHSQWVLKGESFKVKLRRVDCGRSRLRKRDVLF